MFSAEYTLTLRFGFGELTANARARRETGQLANVLFLIPR